MVDTDVGKTDIKREQKEGQMVDITAPDILEVLIRNDGHVLWINTEDGCIMRISGISNLILTDERDPREKHADVMDTLSKRISDEKMHVETLGPHQKEERLKSIEIVKALESLKRDLEKHGG